MFNYKKLTFKELDEWFEGVEFKTKPFKHQLATIAFTIGEGFNRVLYRHGIGTGKTLTALYTLKFWYAKKVLIICPKSIFKTWRDEIKQHTDYTCVYLEGTRAQRIKTILTDKSDIFIINYEGLKSICAEKKVGRRKRKKPGKRKSKKPAYKLVRKSVRKFGFDCIIADECHRFKNHEALQTKIGVMLSKSARYTIMLTGTLFSKSVLDVFGQFQVLDYGATFTNDYNMFQRHFFYKPVGEYDFVPKKVCSICGEYITDKSKHLRYQHNMSLLQYRTKFRGVKERTATEDILDVIAEKSIGYTREECIDLPKKMYQIRYVYPTKEQLDLTYKLSNDIDVSEITSVKLEQNFQKFVQISSGFILHKGEPVFEFASNPKLQELSDLLDDISGKVIIYHNYLHENTMITKLIEKRGVGCVSLNSKTKDREACINSFLHDKDCMYLVAHPKSGGEGLNLQSACNTIIYYSNAFMGSILREQSEGRIHRSGQKNACLYIDIVMENTVDMPLYKALKGNINIVKGLVNYFKKLKR